MSETNPFRLKSCPLCDYALEGLPEIGVCPECGYSYDQDFIILPVTPLQGDAGDPALHGEMSFGRIVPVLIFAVIMITMLPRRANYFLWVMMLTSSVPIAVGLVARWSSLRNSRMLLWLSESGMDQQSTVDPDSVTASIQRWAFWFLQFGFIPVYLLAVSAQSHSIPLLAAFVILWLINLLFWRGRIQPDIQARRPGEPSLYSWAVFETVELERFPNKKFQLLGKRYGLVGPRIPVNVQIDMQTAEADQLRALIHAWRRASKLANPAPTHRAFSRKFGSFLRWMATPIGQKFLVKTNPKVPSDIR